MDEPVQTAPCLLYFTAHGGQLTAKGEPIFVEGAPLYCEVASDCGRCPLLGRWVMEVVVPTGVVPNWECDRCLRWTKHLRHSFPGYYTSGNCLRCGWETPILQLVFRYELPPPPTEEEDEMLPLRGPHSSG